MKKRNKNETIDRLRQAVAGIAKHFASTPNIVLGGQPTTPKDVVTTLTGVIDTIDAAVAAGKAFHTATAAQHASIANGNALLVELKTLVKSQLGSTDAVLGDFGFSNPKRTAPDPATKTAAVAKRAATRTARHTMGSVQKKAVKGDVTGITVTPVTAPKPTVTVPSSPTAPATSGNGTTAAATRTTS